jgi:streptogramin lyase
MRAFPKQGWLQNSLRLSSALLAYALVAGCGGGSGNNGNSLNPAVMPNAPQSPTTASQAQVTFTMHWGTSSSSSLASRPIVTPKYVPATALSVSVAVNGGTAAYLNSPATTLTINAPVGTDTFVFQTYDETNGQGNVLSKATVTQAIVDGKANTVSAVLNGVVAALTISVSNPAFPAGTSGSFPISVAAQDADGNTIVGSSNYSTAITLSINDPAKTGTLSLSANSIASPSGSSNLVYNGGTLVSASVVATAGSATATASLSPTPTVYECPVTGEPQYISQNTKNGSIWFTDSNNTVVMISNSCVLTPYTIPTGNADPQGITGGENGNMWFTEFNASKIAQVTPAGAFTEYATLFPGDSPQMIYDRGDGSVWYSSFGGNHVGYQNQFTGVAGETTLPVAGSQPWGMAEGSDGNLYVVENAGDNVAYLSTLFTSPIPQVAITSASFPESMVRGPDGNMWFTLNGLDRIGELTVPAHVFTSYATASPSSAPVDITVGADGYLYYTESGTDKIGRMNTSGVSTGEYMTISSNTGLKGIFGASDGSIWFCESNSSKVGRLVL